MNDAICWLGDRGAPVRLVVPEEDPARAAELVRLIRERTDLPFRLACLPCGDWNRDLSPWEAPPVFGRESFGGGAAETLARLTDWLDTQEDGTPVLLGGYSLAGLFALWAAYQSDRFRGVAAVSPSVWFPGWTDWIRGRPIRTGAVYLSLGDRESRTRNPVMASVADCIAAQERALRGGVPCVLEWNEGNHFRDAALRTAKGFVWLLEQTARGAAAPGRERT